MKDTLAIALRDVPTKELKALGSSMTDRLEMVQKYLAKEIPEHDIIDYLIIKGTSQGFEVDVDALMKVSNKQQAIALAGMAGGMCEMSEMIVAMSKEVTRRK